MSSAQLSDARLVRTLRFGDLVLLIVGNVIGSGIFLVPGPVLRHVGGHTEWAVTVWICGGVLSLLGALTYGELSSMDPQAGGLYVFLRKAFGRIPAFLYGWALFFVISSGSVAALSVAFGTILGQLLHLAPLGAKAVSVLMILFLSVVNVRGTRQGSDLQNWTTAVKVLALLAISAGLLWLGRGASSALPKEGSFPAASGFGLAMISVLWAYEGWQYCTFSAGETLDPQRNFPRAFLLASVALMALYNVANLSYIMALGPSAASQSDSIAAAAVTAVFGSGAAQLISVVILISIFSGANAFMLTAPRVYYAMAQDGVFFPALAKVHPRFRTPAVAIAASSAWAVLLAVSGTFEELLTSVVFVGWIFYGLGAAALLVFRRHLPKVPRPYRVPGYPWTPLVFILASAGLVASMVVSEAGRAAVGIGLVLAGLPAYALWRRRLGPAVSPMEVSVD